MNIGIMASEAGWHVLRLQEALQQRGAQVVLFSSAHLVARVAAQPRAGAGDIALDDCAALLVRGIPIASLEQVIFRVDFLHRLENRGVRVVNTAGAIEKTVDKYYTSGLLEDAGLPTPRTVVTESFDAAVSAFEELGGDVILKPLFGSEGVGMLRLSDPDLAHRIFRTIELGRYVYYLQEYIQHDGWDIRAFVLGGCLLAAMARHGSGWRTNVAQGARTQATTLDRDLTALAVQAAQLTGCDYAGVDIVCDRAGHPFVLEVNSIPGWRGLQSTVSFDVAGAIADYVFQVAG